MKAISKQDAKNIKDIIDQGMIKTANSLLDKISKITRSYFRKTIDISMKEKKYPVTAFDLKTEEIMTDYISKKFPEHGILGEEYGFNHKKSEYLWVLDPIDGTTSFACGKPTFCTLIGLLKEETLVLGLIDQPISRERWQGVLGSKTLFNGKKYQSQTLNNFNSIRLSCTTPSMFETSKMQRKFEAVKSLASMISYGGDAYNYGLLASGFIDIIFEADLKFYDVAALIPVVEGAGAFITDWEGHSIQRKNFKGEVLAVRNKKLQQNVLKIIKTQDLC